MAKEKDKEVFVEFPLPEALPLGYSFINFTEYLVDRVPAFQSVSGTRKGGKLVDAVVEAAKEEPHLVRWPKDLWKLLCDLLESESFQMPKNYIVRDFVQTDQLVPLRFYLPHVDAILEAKDAPTKSDTVAADGPPSDEITKEDQASAN